MGKNYYFLLLMLAILSSLMGIGTTDAFAVPDRVIDLTYTVVSGNQVDLEWSIPDDNGSPITGYLIQQNIIGEIIILEESIGNSTTFSYSDTTLSLGDEVKYRIAANNADGLGALSNVPSSVTTTDIGAGVPGQVTNLLLTVISGTQVDLSWNKPANNGSTITGYKIDRKLNGMVSTIETDFGDGTTGLYSDTTLFAGDEVTYRMKAMNGIGSGPFSEIPSSVTLGGSISGFVYNDKNGNLVKDGGDQPALGWIVTLTKGNTTQKEITQADSRYSFSQLEDGIYSISTGVS